MKTCVPFKVWLPRFQAIIMLALFATGAIPNVAAAATLEEEAQAYWDSVVALNGALPSRDFYRSWEERFATALATAPKGDRTRLQVLIELGTIQRTLGNHDAAEATFFRAATEGLEARNGFATRLAVGGIWTFHLAKPLPDKVELIGKLEAIYERSLQLDPNVSSKVLGEYSDFLFTIGSEYSRGAGDALAEESRRQMLKTARSYLERSLAVNAEGDVKRPRVLFELAAVLISQGASDEAVAKYDELLKSDQQLYPRLRLAHLRAEALYHRNSADYQKAIEQAFADYPSDDYAMPLRQHLGFSYYSTGKLKDAARIFSAIQGKSRTRAANATNLRMLGVIYQELGDSAAARAVFEDFLRSYPDSNLAEEVRRSIQDVKD